LPRGQRALLGARVPRGHGGRCLHRRAQEVRRVRLCARRLGVREQAGERANRRVGCGVCAALFRACARQSECGRDAADRVRAEEAAGVWGQA